MSIGLLLTTTKFNRMKKALKIGGIVLGLLVLLIALAALYNQVADTPNYEVKAPDLQVELDSSRLARGAKIVSATCTFCHQGEGTQLDGRLLIDDPAFGVIYGANITQDEKAGIGAYTDGELLHLLRTGIKRNGKLAMPMMAKMPHLADEDVYSIIAYLRSNAPQVQASAKAQPAPKLGFIGKALSRLAFQPLSLPEAPIPFPDTNDRVAYGKYLATDLMECANCHSASFETYNILDPAQSPGFFAGGNTVAAPGKGSMLSPNITMHPEKGIGKWDELTFIKAVKHRQRPNGTTLNPLMPDYGVYSDREIAAVWAYLQTIPVSDNDVLLLAEQGK